MVSDGFAGNSGLPHYRRTTHQDKELQGARDQLIATYFPDASPEEAEQHVTDFQRFAGAMTRITSCLAREEERIALDEFGSTQVPEAEIRPETQNDPMLTDSFWQEGTLCGGAADRVLARILGPHK